MLKIQQICSFQNSYRYILNIFTLVTFFFQLHASGQKSFHHNGKERKDPNFLINHWLSKINVYKMIMASNKLVSYCSSLYKSFILNIHPQNILFLSNILLKYQHHVIFCVHYILNKNKHSWLPMHPFNQTIFWLIWYLYKKKIFTHLQKKKKYFHMGKHCARQSS